MEMLGLNSETGHPKAEVGVFELHFIVQHGRGSWAQVCIHLKALWLQVTITAVVAVHEWLAHCVDSYTSWLIAGIE